MKTIIPFMHQAKLAERADAHLLLIKPAKSMYDLEVISFKSRAALEAFNKKPNLTAVVKTQVPLNCALYRHQSDSEARKQLA